MGPTVDMHCTGIHKHSGNRAVYEYEYRIWKHDATFPVFNNTVREYKYFYLKIRIYFNFILN